jgi:hypothetical protein
LKEACRNFDYRSWTSRSVLQQFEDAGIETLGRDPLAGTGLCGPLLPVHTPQDVHYVTLPRAGFDLDDLRQLRKFPNLEQVRCQTEMTEEQDQAVREAITRDTLLLYSVRSANGSVSRLVARRADGRMADEDTNGDGIVNEDDEVLLNHPKH